MANHPQALAIGVLLAATLASPATGEPMSKEACDSAQSELATLTAAGVKDDMAKGPAWAKSNLPREKLAQIRRYIELDEQLLFRCGLAKVRFAPQPDEEPAAPPPPAEKPAPAKPKPKPRPAPAAAKAEAAPAPAPAPASETPEKRPRKSPAPKAEAQATAEPAAKPKPAVKPKVDDAYRPPGPADPAADPFAKQLAPSR